MLCQSCKINNATSHFHSYINGVVADSYLCSECAAKLQNNGFYEDSLYNMLTSFFENEKSNVITSKKCDCCGTTLIDISKSGRVGCGNCYSVFYDELKPGLIKLHGRTAHVGKNSRDNQNVSKDSISNDEKLKILNSNLKAAIENEEYEKAAVIRDEIKGLEGNK